MNKNFELRCLNCGNIITIGQDGDSLSDVGIADHDIDILVDESSHNDILGFKCKCGNEARDY